MNNFTFSTANLENYKPLEAYGLIGDNSTAVLVGADGSIDWACLPAFDAPAVFAALLDPGAGRFRICPTQPYTSRQLYEPGTNILITEFVTSTGSCRLRDFMPYISGRGQHTCEIHRLIEGSWGTVELEIVFEPRFNYGLIPAHLEATPDGILARCEQSGETLTLSCNIPLSTGAHQARGVYQISAGQEQWLVVDWASRKILSVRGYRSPRQIWLTRTFWREWISKLRYQGLYRQAIERSLLTLKMLVYEPTGAIVAAPTASLPEWPGGPRNWDYRYSWIRDSALVLQSLFDAGYMEEGIGYFQWLEEIIARDGTLQPLYGIRGETQLVERELPLRGYRDSGPVRVGNAAHDQLQLDIYGSILDAAVRFDNRVGIITVNEWESLRHLVEFVSLKWREPDAGIWEVRSEPDHFTYSKIWSWVALKRGSQLARRLGVNAPVDRWEQEAQAIHTEVLQYSFNTDLNAFTAAYGKTTLDASVLIMPQVGFLPADDPRFVSTFALIRKKLAGPHNSTIYRYSSDEIDDGIGSPEGTFLLTSFWLVDALTLAGKLSEARAVLDNILSIANPLGLLAEEAHPEQSYLLGNFPQGFSHLGLINSIFRLERARYRQEGWSPPSPEQE